MGEGVDIETASSDVGGDEELGGAVLEATHDSVALLLIHAAVQGFGPVTATVHRGGEFVDLAPGATKDDGGDGCFHVEDAAECVGLVLAHHDVGGLAHAGAFGSRVGGGDLHEHGVALVGLGDLLDPGRHGRRKQHCLSFGGRLLEDRLDVLGEAHVEHFVGLVEHDGADVIEFERAATDVVDRSAGGGDHDMHAAAECLELAGDGLASVDRHDLETLTSAVGVHGFADLDGELSGRDDDERLGHGRRVRRDRLDDGEGERRRFAGAGGGLAEQVDAGQQLGDRFGLDGRGLFVAEFDQAGEELLSETECGEAALLGLDGGGVGIAHCATSKREHPSLGLIRVRLAAPRCDSCRRLVDEGAVAQEFACVVVDPDGLEAHVDDANGSLCVCGLEHSETRLGASLIEHWGKGTDLSTDDVSPCADDLTDVVGAHDDASYDELAVTRLVESEKVGTRGEGDVGHVGPATFDMGPATTMSDATTGGREDQHQRDRQLDQDAGHGAGTATTAVP